MWYSNSMKYFFNQNECSIPPRELEMYITNYIKRTPIGRIDKIIYKIHNIDTNDNYEGRLKLLESFHKKSQKVIIKGRLKYDENIYNSLDKLYLYICQVEFDNNRDIKNYIINYRDHRKK